MYLAETKQYCNLFEHFEPQKIQDSTCNKVCPNNSYKKYVQNMKVLKIQGNEQNIYVYICHLCLVSDAQKKRKLCLLVVKCVDVRICS